MQSSSISPSTAIAESALPAVVGDELHRHAVQFYDNEHFLAAAVADFFADGLALGQTVIVIATTSHREAFFHRLKTKGFDSDQLVERGQLVWLDARHTLANFMVQSVPDRQRFEQVVGTLVEDVVGRARPAKVRAYGEMVDLLWKDGNVEGALQLED